MIKFKNSVFDHNIPVVDMLGTFMAPGDIVAYASSTAMRIGVYIGVLTNKKSDRNAVIALMHHDIQPLTISIYLCNEWRNDWPAGLGYCTLEKVIVLSPEYHINNKLVQKAMQLVDDLIDDGIIKK